MQTLLAEEAGETKEADSKPNESMGSTFSFPDEYPEPNGENHDDVEEIFGAGEEVGVEQYQEYSPNSQYAPSIFGDEEPSSRELADVLLARAASSNNLLQQWDDVQIISDSPVKSEPPTAAETAQQRYERLMGLLSQAEGKLSSMSSLPSQPSHPDSNQNFPFMFFLPQSLFRSWFSYCNFLESLPPPFPSTCLFDSLRHTDPQEPANDCNEHELENQSGLFGGCGNSILFS